MKSSPPTTASPSNVSAPPSKAATTSAPHRIFLLIVSALTPEADNRDTEGYFKDCLPLVFGLMAAFIFSRLFAGFGTTVQLTVARGVAIAVTRKVPLTYVMVIVWLVGLIERV